MGGTTIAGDEKEFTPQVLAFAHFVLDEKCGMDGVEVPTGLDFGVAETEEGVVGGGIFIFRHEPAWGFRTHEDLDADEHRSDGGQWVEG